MAQCPEEDYLVQPHPLCGCDMRDTRHSISDRLSVYGALMDPDFLRDNLRAAQALQLDTTSSLAAELQDGSAQRQLHQHLARKRAAARASAH